MDLRLKPKPKPKAAQKRRSLALTKNEHRQINQKQNRGWGRVERGVGDTAHSVRARTDHDFSPIP